MKCAVIYFSQTGNTEKVAKAVHAGVEQEAGNCDLLKIKDVNPRRLHGYDLIGLGSPVFFSKEPGNIDAFVANMRFLGGKHVFSFCTHGTTYALYFPSLVPKLQGKGMVVVGWNDWYGHNWQPITQPMPYLTDGHPDEIDLREAEEFGSEMVRRSRKIHAGETHLVPAAPHAVPVLFPKLPLSDFKELVKYDRAKCSYPKCRICMDNCPMEGIDLSVDPPVLAKPCIFCTFCEAICPTGAISVPADWLEATVQAERKILKTVCVGELNKAEADGHFRRLFPADKVGWDTAIYKVFSQHPRWIVGKGPNWPKS